MTKKGLLVVSFGTSFKETRAKTLDQIERDLGAAFPDRRLYSAWSSRFIIKKLLKEGIRIDSPEEALDRMLSDGITDALVQPTCIADGAEYRRILSALESRRDRFESLRVGQPLLKSEADQREAARVMREACPQITAADRLILMGHGVPDDQGVPEGNRVYCEMGECLAAEMPNAYLALVEAKPGIAEAREWLKADPPREGGKVYLTPFLLVAGDHANNDLAGDGEDSWKSVLLSDGYEVECVLRGLGELPKIRALYIRHAEEAL